MQAVWEDDVEVVDEWILYLKDNPKDKSGKKVIDLGAPNWNPLHVAVFKNNDNLLRKLILANAGELSTIYCCDIKRMGIDFVGL